jgi:hypothetical protein
MSMIGHSQTIATIPCSGCLVRLPTTTSPIAMAPTRTLIALLGMLAFAITSTAAYSGDGTAYSGERLHHAWPFG